jgi:phage gp29-like protein
MVQLVDRFGRPLTAKKGDLTREVAAPGLTGVRQAWDARTAVVGLTPDRLEAILRQADQGDLDALFTLAQEMEERDPHYASVLQTRKLSVVALERKVTWTKKQADDPRAEEIQEACEELLEADEMDLLIPHLMDSVAKPYAVAETIWHKGPDRWTPERYEDRDPRWFQLDRLTGKELRLREVGAPDGVPLPPFTFVSQFAANKSGLIARRGLARVVAFSFVCKLYGLKDWMAYAEIFGIPLRLGKYGAGATPADVDVLKRAVFGLGSDAAAVIPEGMTIEFPAPASGTGNAELFHALVVFIDNQVSKAVLGQTGTTDMQKGGGFAQAKVLDGVRTDLKQADAKAVGAAIRRDILTPFVQLNWGQDAPVPRAELVVEEPEDMEALAGFLERMVPLGLRVGQSEIRKKARLSEPADDEEVLSPPAKAAAIDPTDPNAKPKPTPGAPPSAANDPAAPARDPALARTELSAEVAAREAADRQLEEAQLAGLEEWQQTFAPEAAAVMDLVKGAGSFEEISRGLERMAADLAAPPAARALARAMFEAAVIGEGGREA